MRDHAHPEAARGARAPPDGDARPVVASVAVAAATPAMYAAPAARDGGGAAPAAAAAAATARVFCAEDDEQLTAAQHMVAGAAAGMSEHLLMFPVDTLKTRMQSYVALRQSASVSMLHVASRLVRTQGAGALWRGCGAVALSAGPAHALHFAAYEATREVLTSGRRRGGKEDSGGGGGGGGAQPVATAVAGASATLVSDAIMAPLDVVKQRMQLSGRQTYGSVLQCVRHVYELHGVRAFYAGYGATLLMNVPFTAAYFGSYESAKHALLRLHQRDETAFDVRAHCVAGGVAGGVAAAGTNPLDVVKTRLQTQGEVGARRYRGLYEALRTIAREEGASGLMRGVKARVLFHVPAAAICWTTYEFCKHLMATQ